MKKRIKYFLACAIVFLGNISIVLAQSIDTHLNSAASTLMSNFKNFLTIAMVLTGISGAISVVWAFLDRKNAQEGANQRLMSVGIGLLVGFVILLIIQAAIGSNTITFTSK